MKRQAKKFNIEFKESLTDVDSFTEDLRQGVEMILSEIEEIVKEPVTKRNYPRKWDLENLPYWVNQRMSEEILKAFKTGDADFFKKFAYRIEHPIHRDPLREWIFSIHRLNENGKILTTFTQSEIIREAKAKRFCGGDDDSIRTKLKRLMKELNLPWKNSPSKISKSKKAKGNKL